ncbi:MAG: helix-turn-helix transcriptional regulator [Actinomycetales bacterium]
MVSTVLAQGRALGDPTRHAIFEHLARRGQQVEVRELTEEFGLHHSAVRAHLAKLRDAGLIVEEPSRRTGPGRPARAYRLTPGAIERWSHSVPYEELTQMLLELLAGGEPAQEVGRRFGRRLAQEVSGSPDDAVDAVEGVTRRLGFDIRRTGRPDDDRVELVLANCPFAQAAERSPEIVCGLHRGVASGVCEGTGGHYRVTDLVIGNPSTGGCRLDLQRQDPPVAPALDPVIASIGGEPPAG